MITHDTLLRVRETARIDEVAAGYLTLRRSGKGSRGALPFPRRASPLVPDQPGAQYRKMLQLRRGSGPHTPRAPHGGMRLRGGRAAAGPQVWHRGGGGTGHGGGRTARGTTGDLTRQRGLRPLPPSLRSRRGDNW